MKKFLSVMLLIVGIVLGSQIAEISSVYAATIQIYDGRINDIIANLRSDCAKYGITDIWGTDYYTYEGVRRCEVNFGSSKNNIIRFRLNNDDSVVRVLISIPNSVIAKDGSRDSFNQAAFMQGSISKTIGLSETEAYELSSKWIEAFKSFGRNNSHVHHYHEKFSVWCAKTQRYIVLDVEMDDSKFDWYLYAYT